MVETYRNKQQEPYHPDIFKKQLEHSSFGKLFLALLDNEFKHEPIEAADIAAFLGNVNSVKTIIRSKKWDVQGLFSKEQAKEIALEQSVKIQATDKFDNLWTEREIMRGYFAPRGLNKELMDNLSSFVSHNWKTHPYVDTPTFVKEFFKARGRLKEQGYNFHCDYNSLKPEDESTTLSINDYGAIAVPRITAEYSRSLIIKIGKDAKREEAR